MPWQIVVTFTGTGASSIDLEDGVTSELIVLLHTPEIDAAPGSLAVSVLDALGTSDIVFKIDGREVFRIEPDPDGNLELATIPVPDLKVGGNQIMLAGTHELTVTQGTASGTVEFEIGNDPALVPEALDPDADPVLVPGALQPNGVHRWVFQDLMPGGLGSWVLPMNPMEMSSPPFTRELTVETTTASEELGGQFHVYEDAFTPVEWTFSGYLPTEEMREKFEAYGDLNRRWYLHDHRGRAWKVVMSDFAPRPRLTQVWNGVATNEGHDYEATVLVLERDWVEVYG